MTLSNLLASTRPRTPFALAALAIVAALGRPAEAAIPGPMTAHHRILYADVVAIVRRKQVEAPKLLTGALHAIEVVRVLANRRGIGDLSTHRLDDAIPRSSSEGDRLDIPQGVPVLIFARVTGEKRLSLIPGCGNSVVRLDGVVNECVVPSYEFAEMLADDFVIAIERLVAEFATFEFLKESYDGAFGSMHPFCHTDKLPLLERLLALADPRVDAFCRDARNDPKTPSDCRAMIEKRVSD